MQQVPAVKPYFFFTYAIDYSNTDPVKHDNYNL